MTRRKQLISRLYHYSYQLEMALSSDDDMADFLEDKHEWFSEIKEVMDEAGAVIEKQHKEMKYK